jgi:sugar phosphate isomerase/epimerase
MMTNRREFAGLLPFTLAAARSAAEAEAAHGGIKTALSCGAIGVKASLPQAVEYAGRYGFQCVEADARWIEQAPAGALETLLGRMRELRVDWAQAGLPADFRTSEENFRASLRALPATARALRRAGVTRMTTWLMPCSPTLTYLENFHQHEARIRAMAQVLALDNIRLGLEYVGTHTVLISQRFPFLHTMQEARELIAATGQANVGLVLDSWHWYMAGDSVADLRALRPADVVSIDLNDAPVGIPIDRQQDGQRELPGATGVIDIAAFLGALNAIGCDAPARCEPFNAALNAMPAEQALAAARAALRKVLARASG